MAFKLVKTGKSYSEQRDTLPAEQGDTGAGSLPEGYHLKCPDAQATREERKEIPKGEHPSSSASPTEFPTGADAEHEFRCWVLEEWRRVSIPDWRRKLREARDRGHRGDEEYARYMLREVLEVDIL